MTDEELTAVAAARRAGQVAQRSHRPSQRRCAQSALAAPVARVSDASLQIRNAVEDGSRLDFTGHASVYERGFEMWDMFGPYTEVVAAGAGAESLARTDLDVPLVLQHESLRRIARTTTGTLILSEDDTGLLVEAPDLDPADPDVAYVAPKITSGLINEMSFMFRITAGQWSPDWTEYRIESYDIHRGDVAIVGYGANPLTDGGFRSAPDAASRLRARVDLELALHP